MNRLLELAERCEKATGEDVAINGDIWKALNPNQVKGWCAPNGVTIDGYARRIAPNYTGSTDAVIATLVPELHTFNIYGQKTGFIARVFPADIMKATWREIPEETKIAATPALALCAAALRSRQSLVAGVV